MTDSAISVTVEAAPILATRARASLHKGIGRAESSGLPPSIPLRVWFAVLWLGYWLALVGRGLAFPHRRLNGQYGYPT